MRMRRGRRKWRGVVGELCWWGSSSRTPGLPFPVPKFSFFHALHWLVVVMMCSSVLLFLFRHCPLILSSNSIDTHLHIFFVNSTYKSTRACYNRYMQLVQRYILHTCAANKCFLFALFIYFDSMPSHQIFRPLSSLFLFHIFPRISVVLVTLPPSEFRASKSKHGRPWTYLGTVPRACVDLLPLSGH